MKQFLHGLMLCLLFVGGAKITSAQDLILASGPSAASIVIGVNANEVEKYAAAELQRCIRIMSGAELPVVQSDIALSGSQIIIGTPEGNGQINAAKVSLRLDGSQAEQTAVLRQGNILYLGGQTARAALYATYTFLQDVLGVRWLWPGESGEYIPQRSTVSVDEVSIFEVPAIGSRSLAITNVFNSNPETDSWQARNRMNWIGIRYTDGNSPIVKERLKKGFQARISGHFIWLSEDILSAHPEYAALYNGSRSYTTANRAHICWGNPGVQDEVAKLIARLWAESPLVDAMSFYPVDNQTYCSDELCRNLAPDVSTRWQKFSQIVIEKVDQTYPGKSYRTLAYQGFKDVPQIVASRFQSVGYTLYEASYRHLLSSGYSGSAGAITEIEGWQAKGIDVGLRGYEYIMFRDPMFVPMVSWEMDQMSWMIDKGLISYSSELPPFGSPGSAAPENTYWMCNRMNLYAAAKGLWNPEITADSIVNDWCKTIYGPAADEMIAYYWDIEQLWRNAPGDIQEYNKTPASQVDNFLSPEAFIRLNGYFTQARTKLAGIADADLRNRIAEQIQLESKMLANWQAVHNFKNNKAGHFETAIEKVDALSNATWNEVLKLPAFKDKTGAAVTDQTVVSKAWTETHLNFRIVCQDGDIASRIANATVDDDVNVTADDCIELYIQPDAGSPAYMHFAVNTLGKKYDAISLYGGTDFDKSWNPEWTVTTDVSNDGWTVDIQIPFSALGITAEDSRAFKMAVKRSMGGRSENSGWPDATYFNPATFGLATLVTEIPDAVGNRVILFDGGGISSGNVSTEFQQRGWDVVNGIEGEDQLRERLNEDAAVLLLRSPTELSTSFYLNEIRNYLEKGRVVIIATARNLPIDEWFPGTPATVWSGNNQNVSASRASFQLPGAWMTYPNNLTSEIRNRPTPVTAYIPQAEGWRILLKMPMRDGTDQPFLMSRRIGNGLLVLTSSNMGYSGGYELFGNRRITNAVRLTENFKAEQEGFEIIKREQKITFANIPEKVLGEPDFTLAATSDSGLPVTLNSSNKAVAIVVDGTVHLKATGTTIITASQEGNETYDAAETVERELVVIADVIAPTMPGDLSAVATDSTVTLQWSASTDFIGVTGYLIYKDEVVQSISTITSLKVGGLRSSVTYDFKVVAIDAAGNQSPAAVISVLTPDTQRPSTPMALSADKTNKHKVALNWQPSTDNVAVIGYDVYQNGIRLNSSLIGGTDYQAERPTGTDIYEFTVQSVDAAGNVSFASNAVISANGVFRSEGFLVYPNPSHGTFKVHVNTTMGSTVTIHIFDSSGTLMQSTQYLANGSQKPFEFANLPSGNYVVRVTVNDVSHSKAIFIH